MALHVPTPDGRTLEVLDQGGDGFPLVFHFGTPTAAVPDPVTEQQAAAAGLRLVTFSRPGYGASSPRSDGASTYRVADDVQDTVTVLDALGVTDFVTLGWSGGGPRALACAALLPDRCRAASTLAGVAPVDGEDLDFLEGMGPENVRDFTAARDGAEALERSIAADVEQMSRVTGDEVVAAFGGVVTGVDVDYLTGEFAEQTAISLRAAMTQGSVGYRDDNLAISRPWGFDVASISVPVSVWQGREDLMVPFAHGIWLADHVPNARRHLYDDEGHLSLISQLPGILADLRELAGLSAR